ncbi:MmgE/PrpD family protein [Lichenibacterium minor]|uniref:MmgE/PrpD family protein n=1 Tax=Lichenibacterium minor TaxID=2316528 RepID=A0A4Q2UBY7_9HYPH|nr:MmgE/PrpD family protein [Lichenibacterium minor]RYC32375.1 MmgE/PrpD family protein [Lichenibacterium minor]
MAPIQRRTLLRNSAAAAAAALTGGTAVAQTGPAPDAKPAAAPPPGAAPKGPPPEPVTHILARYAATAPASDIPPNVRHEAARTLLNWVGVAVGGSRQGAPNHAVKALLPFSGPAQANLFGRAERMDALHAALVNGISSHVLDFDDTHLRTIIHPAGPVASALTAWSQYRPLSGADAMNALVIGCEVELRLGNSVFPEHYAKGWHITGTTGVFGSAAATGRALGLDERRMTWAIGLAASQPVGLKVQFGSDTKSFHPGRAAQNGMVSALLAEQGFTASEVAIEGFDGWGQAMSTRHDWSEVTEGLGTRYEIALNTYKPFAAGIVSHPAIDAAIQLRDADHIQPDQIKSVDLKVHPLVLNLMGKTDPKAGLEGKFSIYHAVAVALVTGHGGEKAFTDAAVTDPQVVAVRKTVTAEIDPAIKADQVDMTVTLKDGRVLHKFIEHAVGSQANPMTDAQLAGKFTDLCDGILPPDRAKRLLDLCWGVWDLKDVGEIGRAAAALA